MKKLSIKDVSIGLLDFLKSVLLCIYGFILGPLGVLRGPLALGLFFSYIFVLSPLGLLSQFIVLSINWRLGRFGMAIMQAENLITELETEVKKETSKRRHRKVLEDIYTLLARAYLHSGHIDNAMLVVIRAKKNLGIERLPGLAELNSKTAHLIRAGLSAGKLLDGGGLATLFVKTPNTQAGSPRPLESIKEEKPRQGASSKENSESPGAQIIPFPTPKRPELDPNQEN